MELVIKKLSTPKFLWRAVNDLIGNRGIRDEIPLPSRIGELEFVKMILEDKKNNKFQYGFYKDSTGKEYMAKQLSLKNPGIDEYWLRNEINSYSIFTKIYKQKGKIIRESFPDICIPKLVTVIDDKTRLLFISEKISGKPLTDMPMNERISSIERATQYFRFLNLIHDFRDEIITKRSSLHMLIMLPLASLGALKNHPDQWRKILRGLKEIIRDSVLLFKQKEMELIHRDIGYSNILVDHNNTKNIIDFELSSYMHPMWEIAQIVVGCRTKEGFNDAFMESPTMVDILNDKKQKRIYKLFSIYCGIYLLATHNKKASREKIESGKEYFDYVLKL